MAGNPDCKKEGHNMHICALKASGFDTENPDKFREITENPQYKCDNCGAISSEQQFGYWYGHLSQHAFISLDVHRQKTFA